MKNFVNKLTLTVGLLAIASVCFAEVPAPRVQKVKMNPVSAPQLKNQHHSSKVGGYEKFVRTKGSGPSAVNFMPLSSNGDVVETAYARSRHMHEQFMPVRLAGVYHRYAMMSMWDIKESEKIRMPTASDADTLHVEYEGPLLRQQLNSKAVAEVTPNDLKLAADAPLLREGVSQ